LAVICNFVTVFNITSNAKMYTST